MNSIFWNRDANICCGKSIMFAHILEGTYEAFALVIDSKNNNLLLAL